jgi:hypothetical protein
MYMYMYIKNLHLIYQNNNKCVLNKLLNFRISIKTGFGIIPTERIVYPIKNDKIGFND